MTQLSITPDVHSRARLAGYDPSILGEACVLVVGAGALGQNLAMDLALSGVRELRIVDGDAFESHNLSRSPLHPRGGAHDGRTALPKASSVAHELEFIHIDDEARVRFADTWIEELGIGAFDGVDVIAACVDALPARAYLARIAMQLNLPIVDGGFSGANLGMTVYPRSEDPSLAPCWSCGGTPLPGAFSCQEYARHAAAAGVVPAIQAGAAALGALCAEAVIGLLHGREPLPRRVTLDLRTGESRRFRPSADPQCAAGHRRLPAAHETDLSASATVAAALSEIGATHATLFPPDIYVERANCPAPACHATCEVGAPSHRWRRDARCRSCGGPWLHAAEQIPSPDIIDAGLTVEDPRSSLTLAQLGGRPGDVVELADWEHAAIRLRGGPDDLYDEGRERS
jgi:molybdopterin/thiamine biosynthesis adenylyltransferase